MERLLFALLKLVLRLVLFAWTGDWNKLDELQRKFRGAMEELKKQARQGQLPARGPRPPRQKRARPESPWPFEFAPEQAEPELEAPEPMSELAGGESVSQPTFKRRRPKGPRVPPAPAPQVSLARAARQPRMIRDAIILTAALGPRNRGGRRF